MYHACLRFCGYKRDDCALNENCKITYIYFFTGFAFAIDYFCTIVVGFFFLFFFFFRTAVAYVAILAQEVKPRSKPYHTHLSHDEHQPKTNVPKGDYWKRCWCNDDYVFLSFTNPAKFLLLLQQKSELKKSEFDSVLCGPQCCKFPGTSQKIIGKRE